MKETNVEVEGIKLAVSMFRKTDPKRCREVLLESIRWLKDRYIRLGEKEDLQKALLHIQAYGDLGFPYQDVETDLLEIFDSLGAKKEVRKAFRKLFCETIVINKSVINRLLGSWNPARQSMRIGDAVNDIIQKVTKKEEGTYLYHCKTACTERGRRSVGAYIPTQDTGWRGHFPQCKSEQILSADKGGKIRCLRS